jgi:hypothetical protein
MALDLNTWRTVIKQAVDGIADEAMQRRAWFGIGPEVSSPDEVFCQFFDDAAIEDFLKRSDTGLNDLQLQAGKYLTKLMRELSKQTAEHIDPSNLIDDPRWRKVREAAARFATLLATNTTEANIPR